MTKRKTLFLTLLLAATTGAQTLNPALWSGMKYRMIGPERGGRVTTVTGVPSQPFTFYMGSTGGGVWKTPDAGHPVPPVPGGPPPPFPFYRGPPGGGVWKTTDAGHSWSNISDGFFSAASM